jgi:hypothetical protein
MEKLLGTFIHNYEGYGKCKSKCKVYMVSEGQLTHFCFEELDDNPGTSITNMSEHLATQMIEKFNLKPYQCFFYETYPHSGKDRSFDEIKYTWIIDESPKPIILKATKPQWKFSDKHEIFELTI